MAKEIANQTLESLSEGDALPLFSYEVTPTTVVLGAMASRDWRPMHHDKDFAVNRNGTRDIFMNTPNQAAWFEKYLTDWSGPKGRLGRIQFRMKDSVFPGDTMTFSGKVEKIERDETGCGWAHLDLELKVGEKTVTGCAVKMALPVDRDDNPWKRSGSDWSP